MKAPSNYIALVIAAIVVAVAYGQPTVDTDHRITGLQQAVEQLKKSPRSMEQISPAQDRLLERIVDEVIFLHRENTALRKEVERLKSK